METIAVYWEHKIRTYGFNLLEGLTLYRFALPTGTQGQWNWMQPDTAHRPAVFRLVWAQIDPAAGIRLCLVSEEISCNGKQSVLDKPVDRWGSCERVPVDLVFFQGPHFGDRYGIMNFTFRALPANVPLLGTVCATATIYLVFPRGQGRAACDSLHRAFEIPVETGKKM
jgi:hypothetical protein